MKRRKIDVVERTANALLAALQQNIEEHHETIEAIRRDLQREARRD